MPLLGNRSARRLNELDVCVLVGNDRCCAVEFRNAHGEWLVVGLGPIPQDAQRYLLAQQHTPVIGTSEVDAGVNSVAKGDVERNLAEFSVDVESISVRSGVVYKRKAVRGRLLHIRSGREKQRADLLASIKEEFQRSGARASHRCVASGVAGCVGEPSGNACGSK